MVSTLGAAAAIKLNTASSVKDNSFCSILRYFLVFAKIVLVRDRTKRIINDNSLNSVEIYWF